MSKPCGCSRKNPKGRCCIEGWMWMEIRIGRDLFGDNLYELTASGSIHERSGVARNNMTKCVVALFLAAEEPWLCYYCWSEGFIYCTNT